MKTFMGVVMFYGVVCRLKKVRELKKDGTLILEHEHDGRDLELSEANKVFEHINHLWHGDVRFTTIIEDETWEF
jgi:stage V sporulation protein R